MAGSGNPFVRAGKYFSTWFGSKVDEHADPKVQIQQAIEDAQRQHQALTQQAASVIGNQRQLEMKLNRQLGQVEQLQDQARQALVLADRARVDGDAERAAGFEQTAQNLANQLVAAEGAIEDLKQLHDQALGAARQARQAVEDNRILLEDKLAQRTRLLSQLEQAKMQESVARSMQSMSALAPPGNTPSLDEVRDKIEQRYARALGQSELAADTDAGRVLEVRRASQSLQGAARLAEIRAAMTPADGGPAAVGGTGPHPAVGPGADVTAEGAGSTGGGSARPDLEKRTD